MNGVEAISRACTGLIFGAALRLAHRRRHTAFVSAAEQPREVQARLLRDILTANASTAFGRRHDFSRIRTIDEFRSAVPVLDYEALRPYVERQEQAGERSLTSAPPVYFHRTSGTLGKPKDIPVTQAGLTRIKHNQQVLAYAVARGSRAFQGKIFAVTGQAVEDRLPGGTACGSASGLLARSQSGLVRARYVLPPDIADIEDHDSRYLVMAAYGMAEPAVSCFGTANPSTLLRLQAVIQADPDRLLRAIHDGGLPGGLSDDAARLPGVAADRGRAGTLADVLARRGTLNFADIWPHLQAVVTWTGGSCKVALRQIAGALPPSARIIELGYLASEFQGTVNVDVATATCLPTLRDTVFEFAERESRETGGGDFLQPHELSPGQDYYVFVTTPDGLYRYDMNDIVRVTGMLNGTPCLAFVQKGKGVTSITGEKLYEAQVIDAVMDALRELNADCDFFIMLADRETAGYTLYIESAAPAAASLATAVDRRMGAANIEYASKRDSGRLAPLRVRPLTPGTGAGYRADRIRHGQRDAQFKYLHLQYAHECPFDFAAHCRTG